MTSRFDLLAEVGSHWLAVEGDTRVLEKRLREGAVLSADERTFLADLLAGKKVTFPNKGNRRRAAEHRRRYALFVRGLIWARGVSQACALDAAAEDFKRSTRYLETCLAKLRAEPDQARVDREIEDIGRVIRAIDDAKSSAGNTERS